MKKLIILACLVMAANCFSQDCQNPLSANSFQQFFNGIAAQPTEDKKLARAQDMLRQSCLTSQQVKNIAVLFTDERVRLEFCESAWHKTFDRVNFFDVLESFTSLSNAMRLYDYTRTGIANIPTGSPMPVAINQDPVFANIPYPSDANYTGAMGCPGPILSESTFLGLAREMNGQPTDAEKVNYVKSQGSICMGMAQLMKLASLLKIEEERLNFMGDLFVQVRDQNNYAMARALFTAQINKDQWSGNISNYLAQNGTPAVEQPKIVCATEADFKYTMQRINKQTFPTDKMNELKAAARKSCYTMAQIRQFCSLFIGQKDKLDIMKMFYPKSIEKDRYHQLADVFTSTFYQLELNKFIKANSGK
jgi:hypothetical protein